jgi:predicted site-specific integrase-resolvase
VKKKRDWVSVAEVALALDVHRATVLLWINAGKIPGVYRIHDTSPWRIPRAWLEEKKPPKKS